MPFNPSTGESIAPPPVKPRPPAPALPQQVGFPVCPPIDPRLIGWLESTFPARDLKPGDDPRDALYYSGQRQMISFLRTKLASQEYEADHK